MNLAWTPADWELDFSFIRASGPGGQNENRNVPSFYTYYSPATT